MSGSLAALVARASGFLLEPAAAPEAAGGGGAGEAAAVVPRPLVAVFGLAPRAGTTTVARGLAAALAARDPGRTAVVAGGSHASAAPIAAPAALRLARGVAAAAGAPARASGRLCLVAGGDLAALERVTARAVPLVADVAPGSLPAAAALADRTVLVADARVEPALAALVAASVARVAAEPLVVLNRAGEPSPGAGPWSALLPDAPAAARAARAGREPRGAFGAALAALADLVAAGAA